MTDEIEKFDLLVLGSGPAGEKGAAQAAYFGKKVALVERWAEPGGVSVHTGTLPSKTLREAALYLTGFHRRELYGMTLRLDKKSTLRQLTGRLRDVTERQTRQVQRNLDRHQITVLRGQGRFLDAKTVAVFDADDTMGRRLTADVILIAVGSSPLPPRGISFDDPDLENSDQVLNLDRIPETLAVVGGGVIGCEYASIFAALGSRVTLIEGRDRLLGFLDGEMSSTLSVAFERMGGEILLGDSVESIHRQENATSNALRLKLKSGRVLKADKVLYSAGRKGNTDGLGLEAAGITFDEKGKIGVDANFQTNVPGVYAAGDVIGFPALAATSMEQARVAMCHAFGFPFLTSVSSLFPYGIYTIPEISMIGATEEELKAKGIPYEVGRSRYENNARGQIIGDPDGFVKLIFTPDTHKLLGAHLIGGSATELVHIPQMVMAHGGGLEEFLHAVFNFPTLAECFKYAAYDGLQRLAHRNEAASALSEGRPPREKLAATSIPPAGRPWALGMDLTGIVSLEPRPVTVAAMDRWRRVRFRTWTFDPTGERLVSEEIAAEGFVLAIGGPQGVAPAGEDARACDRALAEQAKAARTRLGAPDGKASLAIFSALRKSGLGLLGEAAHDATSILEVSPEDLFRKWGGARIPKKSLPSGRRSRFDILRGLGLELPVGADAITYDQLDAAAAAYAAYLWSTGQAKTIGDIPEVDPKTNRILEGLVVTV
ncbi:MAG: Si-specific NAD(P)(+) transhydrogenase [Thermoanaerobaculia bacterium]